MKNPVPTFPPLLSGHKLEAGKIPFKWAKARVAKGKLSAGDIVWSDDTNTMQFALILEPEVDAARSLEMLYLLMVAFGDAAGALCPPEVSVQYQWPSIILMNGASIGSAHVETSNDFTDEVPNWMVAGLSIDIKPMKAEMDPGLADDKTTLWDEGCGDISRTELIESVSRHTVNWIHTWSEEGYKPIHDVWWGRLHEKNQLSAHLQETGELIGLDENGNALIRRNEEMIVVSTREGLQSMPSLMK